MRDRHVVLRAVVLAVGLLLLAHPAAADPAGPTNYRSSVAAVDAPTDGVRAQVIGGDAFLVVRAEGAEVLVPGYDGEPYLWFAPDGTVSINDRSPARWLNDGRYGAQDVDVPATADSQAPPRWREVADDGIYAWHDHRIHYMAPTVPRTVDPDHAAEQRVFDWQVPIVVDGQPATIRGTLTWVPSPSPVVGIGTVLAAALVIALVTRTRRAWATPAVAAGGGVTLVAGAGLQWGLPPGAAGDATLIALPLAALGLAAVAAIARRCAPAGRWIIALAAVPLAVWGLLVASALVRPIVPGIFAPPVVRAAVILAFIAAGIAMAAPFAARRST
ncbi:MAG: hypothetical protein WD011_01310 [Nitriliruptoraceae bacterium]